MVSQIDRLINKCGELTKCIFNGFFIICSLHRFTRLVEYFLINRLPKCHICFEYHFLFSFEFHIQYSIGLKFTGKSTDVKIVIPSVQIFRFTKKKKKKEKKYTPKKHIDHKFVAVPLRKHMENKLRQQFPNSWEMLRINGRHTCCK